MGTTLFRTVAGDIMGRNYEFERILEEELKGKTIKAVNYITSESKVFPYSETLALILSNNTLIEIISRDMESVHSDLLIKINGESYD